MIRLSASISLMWREVPLLERFTLAKAAGFEGVEIQFLDEADPAAMARAATDAGIAVALVNVPAGDFIEGGPGLSGVPGREAAFRSAFALALDTSELLGAATLHLGPSRIAGTRAHCETVYRRNLDFARAHAADAGPRLVIEAMNRTEFPDALLSNLNVASALAREHDVGLLFDAYHAAMNGEHLAQTFAMYADVTAHVQVADSPGRGAPGTGAIDYAAFWTALHRAGYSGWVGAEYLPGVNTSASLGWLPAARSTLSG